MGIFNNDEKIDFASCLAYTLFQTFKTLVY